MVKIRRSYCGDPLLRMFLSARVLTALSYGTWQRVKHSKGERALRRIMREGARWRLAMGLQIRAGVDAARGPA